MTRLTYRDAVKILGPGNNALVSALDKIFGGLLLAATPVASGLLSILDAKSELTKVANDLVTRGVDKRQKLTQFDRIQRLHAARGVLVVTSYFEALAKADLPFLFNGAAISRKDATGLAFDDFTAKSLADVTRIVLNTDLPVLGIHAASAEARYQLAAYYDQLGQSFLAFLSQQPLWNTLDAFTQSKIGSSLSAATQSAVEQFESSMQRLATDCPEFAIWLTLSNQRATRNRVENVYDAVRQLLDRAEPIDRVPPVMQGLIRANRAVLKRKVLKPEELPDGLDAPTVERAYIDPHFRMTEVNTQTPVNDEDYWSGIDFRENFGEFLLGYLSTPWALVNPLVVLGHPGAGKSLLTEVQAAQLPAPDFVPVRVPLRDVAADVNIHEQIEQAIRLATHETVSWPDFARAAGDSVLVVLVDGFDELIQATGVSKSDYLLRVKAFQEVEQTQGRHVAVIVTSRVTVADRMRIPGNTIAVRLEPFEIDQIEQWVGVWNRVNDGYLSGQGRDHLSLEIIEAYLELASQPLLLLMLAIYDAESGALSTEREELSEAELYERLLIRFAHREVTKTDSTLTGDDPEVERELLTLSVVAFGMFNRGAQWITDSQLAEDLTALGITSGSQPGVTSGHQRLAGSAKDALGRFFFVHRARTSIDGTDVGSYEFLHATFGEYLVVRQTWRRLLDMVERTRFERTRRFPTTSRIDDAVLRALLSHSLLSVRTTTMNFLSDFVTRTTVGEHAEMRAALLAAFHALHLPPVDLFYDDYRPAAGTPTARLATYSANLLLLLMTVGSNVTSAELFPDSTDNVEAWRQHMTLLRSQLKPGEWSSLTQLFVASRLGRHPERSVKLNHRGTEILEEDYSELSWAYGAEPTVNGFSFDIPSNLAGTAELIQDFDTLLAVNVLGGPESPLTELLSIHLADSRRGLTAIVTDLLAACCFHANRVTTEERMAVYDRLIRFTEAGVGPSVGDLWGWLDSLILQLLVNDTTIPTEYIQANLDALSSAIGPPRGLLNLELFLRLLSRSSKYEYLLKVFEQLLTGGLPTHEQIAEIWCALAEKGVPVHEYPEALRDQAVSLRQPERDEHLAHRPDLLQRLSALEDAELL
ncbi:NACHT domain-containing protein [Amycolatopsis sp. NPDC004747]